MKNELSTFQTVLLVVFGMALFVGVLIFAGVIPGFRAPDGGTGGTVTVWGPLPDEALEQTVTQFQKEHESEFTFVYVGKDSRVLEAEMTEALATGKGPDLVILPHTSILKQGDKLVPFSYESITERLFLDTFAREGALYLAGKGILALPLALDPMVLYYNVDSISGAGMLAPPRLWSEMQAAVKSLNVVDAKKNIQFSAVPFGKANNISNAKDLLAMLILQAGNPLATYRDFYKVVLADESNGKNSAEEALSFFSRFADPNNALYSWNSAMPEARESFIRNQAAMYFGYASEYDLIRKQNPQLNIDIAPVPQVTANSQLTIGRLWGISQTRGAKNPLTAQKVAFLMSTPEFAAGFARAGAWAPALSSLLRTNPQDPIETVRYRSAIISRGWLEPDPARTQALFRQMIEAVQSGSKEADDAISQTGQQLQSLVQ